MSLEDYLNRTLLNSLNGIPTDERNVVSFSGAQAAHAQALEANRRSSLLGMAAANGQLLQPSTGAVGITSNQGAQSFGNPLGGLPQLSSSSLTQAALHRNVAASQLQFNLQNMNAGALRQSVGSFSTGSSPNYLLTSLQNPIQPIHKSSGPMPPSFNNLIGQQHTLLGAKPVNPDETRTTKVTSTLHALGSNLRKKSDPYIDVSTIDENDIPPEDSVAPRGGVADPFPQKVHRMLEEVEKEGKSDIVSFYSHGRAFGVHDIDRFVDEILPKYFERQSKWNSFNRQLNLYGFVRITSGEDIGGYYHELFLKGRPNLCRYMRRVGVPHGEDRRKIRQKEYDPDPDFYSMRKLTN